MAHLVKNPPAVQETLVGKIPWRRERLPTQMFWPREFHRLYSSWGCKELDRTGQLSLWLSHPQLKSQEKLQLPQVTTWGQLGKLVRDHSLLVKGSKGHQMFACWGATATTTDNLISHCVLGHLRSLFSRGRKGIRADCLPAEVTGARSVLDKTRLSISRGRKSRKSTG